jgi:Protein of unknown function (DUF3306)
MNDPEKFFKRWSRRKHEAADENAHPKKGGAEQANEPTASLEDANQGTPSSGAAAPPMPEFDVSSLPPIESINASSDITAFMRPGVPAALRHAALRRAWSADPAIRNFMGPTENYWDVAGPEGVPGFGDLDPNLDIKRLVSEVFGEPALEGDGRELSGSVQKSEPSATSSHEAIHSRIDRDDAVQQAAVTTGPDLLHGTENAAAQNSPAQSPPEQKPSRRHGRAMPQ